MPITGSSRDTMDKLLRTVYRDRLREQFPSRAFLLQEIPTEAPESFTPGDSISVPLHIGGSGGFAFSSDGVLPAAGHSLVDRANFLYKMMVDRIEIAGDFQQDTSSKASAEKKILDMETNGVIRDAKRGLCFHMYGDGTGKLAGVSSSASSTTLIVDDIAGIPTNAVVDILKTSDGSVGSGAQGVRVLVQRATKTLTLQDGAVLADYADLNTNAADYTVYRQGSRNDAILGLQAWVSASNPPAGVGNIGGLDRSLPANDFYCGNVFGNSGVPREPTFPLMQDMLDSIDEFAEGETKLILCHPRVHNWISFQLAEQKRFVHERATLRGWCSAILFGDMRAPIVKDPMCPKTKMFFLDPSLWRIWQVNGGEWMQEDGAVLHRVPNRVAYEASWFRRLQFLCLKPSSAGVIEDLTTELASI